MKDYVSQDALRQPRLPIVVNMYQNVNDSLLLNLVKGVTSPERVVRAGQSGGFGLLLRFRVILFRVAICQSWKGKGEDFFLKRENKNSFDQDRVFSFFFLQKGRENQNHLKGKEEGKKPTTKGYCT